MPMAYSNTTPVVSKPSYLHLPLSRRVGTGTQLLLSIRPGSKYAIPQDGPPFWLYLRLVRTIHAPSDVGSSTRNAVVEVLLVAWPDLCLGVSSEDDLLMVL